MELLINKSQKVVKLSPIYTVRKAVLSDVMFFYESIKETANLTLNENEFDIIFKSKLKTKHNQLIVLLDQFGHAAGCAIIEFKITLTEGDLFSEMQFFYIQPKYRKYFAAEALYNEIEQILLNKKCKKLIVSTLLNATINQRFYTKRGFKFVKKTYQKMIL